jgi:hypothetical protein
MAALLLVLSLIVLNELHLPGRIDEMTPRLKIRHVVAPPRQLFCSGSMPFYVATTIICTNYNRSREWVDDHICVLDLRLSVR